MTVTFAAFAAACSGAKQGHYTGTGASLQIYEATRKWLNETLQNWSVTESLRQRTINIEQPNTIIKTNTCKIATACIRDRSY